MDKKHAVIIVTIIGTLLIILLALIYMLKTTPKTPSNLDPTQSPRDFPISPGTDDIPPYIPVITLAPKNGEVELFNVKLNDFTPLITRTPDSKTGILKESFGYTLEYEESTGFFSVNFNEIPSENEIVQAETDLLQILGINEEDGCRQSIVVMIPSESNPNEKTQLMPTFCEH